MTALSLRFVPVLIVLVFLALIPVGMQIIRNPRTETCADPDALRDVNRFGGAKPGKENLNRLTETRFQFTEGELPSNGRKLTLRAAVVRSYVGSDVSSRPPRFLLGEFEAEEKRLDWVDVDGESVPIHTIFDVSGGRGSMASYMFVYGGRPVANPLVAELKNAIPQLWKGAQPMTVMVVAGEAPRSGRDVIRERAQAWLMDAWRYHRAVCNP